jgi:hypothetical protein
MVGPGGTIRRGLSHRQDGGRAVGFRSKTTGFFSAEGEADGVRAMLKEVWHKHAIAS